MVLKSLEAGKGSAASEHLVAKTALVLFKLIVLVDLLVVLFVIVPEAHGEVV